MICEVQQLGRLTKETQRTIKINQNKEKRKTISTIDETRPAADDYHEVGSQITKITAV